MARFEICWTETVDYCGSIDIDGIDTVEQFKARLTDPDFAWYPDGDTHSIDPLCSCVEDIPYSVELIDQEQKDQR